MGLAKWIGGYLGWVAFGPIGALLGFWLGAAVDGYIDSSRRITSGNGGSGSRTYTRTTSSGSGYGPGGSCRRTYTQQEQRNSFMVSLLVLSAAIIKADGKNLQAEKDYVRDFVRRNFGDSAVQEAMQILEQLMRQDINIYTVGAQIAGNMNYSQRLQLFHYLVQLALADGDFSRNEKAVLETVGSTIGLSGADINSVISMFYRDTNSAYAVLEISPDATDEEVRTAYRKMAMKNHPDKVATLGPDVQKAAAEKFRQIQDAYESIKRERGMN